MSRRIYQQARFLKSAARLDQAPADRGLEVAFAGRSNAGKSSALNALTGQRGLARTSKTPGRTQLINFFVLDERRRLVDLPGYGYARVPQAVKARWDAELARYLEHRRSLTGLVLLMDVRHPLTDYDRQLIAWAAAGRLPLHVLLTKADKLKRGPASNIRLSVTRELERLHPDASVQLFSATRREGVDELAEVLDGWLEVPETA